MAQQVYMAWEFGIKFCVVGCIECAKGEVGCLVLYARREFHLLGVELASGRIGDNGSETMDLGPYECANCGQRYTCKFLDLSQTSLAIFRMLANCAQTVISSISMLAWQVIT